MKREFIMKNTENDFKSIIDRHGTNSLKWDYFDEKNIIILEGDKNKISESTESNTICSYLFSEEFLSYDLKRKYEVEKEGNRLINYVVDLLENCPNDVRDYIAHNSIVNYFNEDKTDVDVLWRSTANILYTNWLNYYVYQITPFDFKNPIIKYQDE